jgi:hypothetical protein
MGLIRVVVRRRHKHCSCAKHQSSKVDYFLELGKQPEFIGKELALVYRKQQTNTGVTEPWSRFTKSTANDIFHSLFNIVLE